jgi:hypothetical protein
MAFVLMVLCLCCAARGFVPALFLLFFFFKFLCSNVLSYWP